jgi:uncharacterized protein YjbI with pentapeptide repeats
MANPEHVALLRKSVREWNEWRKANPELRVDLSGVDLSGAELSGANLSGADLSGAELRGAELRGANLWDGNLSEANLWEANLSGAYLITADFSDANLTLANLRRADLNGADLNGADLSHTILSQAKLAFTRFTNVDLSETVGLETCNHEAPSSIGIDTIIKSRGNIPEVFLRGAGVPEPFIASMKSLVAAMSPIQFYSCFISYSTKDQEFADRLHADLQAKGVRCWFAPEDLKIGDKFRTRIDESIRVFDKLLLVLSEHSISSPWVEEEVEAALERERRDGRSVLFPIRLDDAVMESQTAWAASLRRTRHVGDFCKWKDHDAYGKVSLRQGCVEA